VNFMTEPLGRFGLVGGHISWSEGGGRVVFECLCGQVNRRAMDPENLPPFPKSLTNRTFLPQGLSPFIDRDNRRITRFPTLHHGILLLSNDNGLHPFLWINWHDSVIREP